MQPHLRRERLHRAGEILETFVEAVSTRDKKVFETPYEGSYRSNILA